MSSLYAGLQKRFDSKKTFTFEDLDPFNEESNWISTGDPFLDYCLKTLGYPSGIIEVRGKSQSGKTTISLHAAMQNQRQYKDRAVTIFLSSERRDNKPYAKTIGLNLKNVLIHRVVTIEDTINKIHQTITAVEAEWTLMIREETKLKHKVTSPKFNEEMDKVRKRLGKPRYLFIWDSLGQTISAQEKKKMEERATTTDEAKKTSQPALGAAARALSMGLRSMVGLSDDHDATLYIINRPYSKVDGVPGLKSYGGEAITLYPTMRFDLARIQGLKGVNDVEVGQVTQLTTLKTDFDRPKSKFKIEILYGYGMILTKESLDEGIRAGILKAEGAHGASFMNGKMKWTSRKGFYKHYFAMNPLLKVLHKRLTTHFHNKFLKEHAEKSKK